MLVVRGRDHLKRRQRAGDASARGAAPKSERLEARISRQQKEIFQHAADLEGRSLTDFVLASVQRAAEQTIREHDVITLSARDSRAFVKALLHPEPASERLRAAAERYKAIMGDR